VTDQEKDTQSPTLKVHDGNSPHGRDAQEWIKKLFDMDGTDFLGSGMTFHEWDRLGDALRYRRWLGNQARGERRRRMKYVVALSVEHARVCEQDRFATAWSESTIEAVINGDWNEVKMWTDSLKFEDEGADIRNIAAPKFAKFVQIATEAYETRPKVFCPLCRRPPPERYIRCHDDGRHHCPWCKIEHDDAGEWVEQEEEGTLSAVPEESDD